MQKKITRVCNEARIDGKVHDLLRQFLCCGSIHCSLCRITSNLFSNFRQEMKPKSIVYVYR